MIRGQHKLIVVEKADTTQIPPASRNEEDRGEERATRHLFVRHRARSWRADEPLLAVGFDVAAAPGTRERALLGGARRARAAGLNRSAAARETEEPRLHPLTVLEVEPCVTVLDRRCVHRPRLRGKPARCCGRRRGLSTEQMQAIAHEFNLSETTFVLPPESKNTPFACASSHPRSSSRSRGIPPSGARSCWRRRDASSSTAT